MKITVVTVYENVPASQTSWWAEKVFDSTWARRELGPAKLMDLKRQFLAGKEATASTKDPEGTGRATTTWRLEET